MARIKAFQLDAERLGADPEGSDPYTFGVFPGLWTPGRPVAPEALGLDYKELRELVDRLGLPLVEVQVDEKKALTSFPEPEGRMESAPLTITGEFAEGEGNLRPAHEVAEIGGSPLALPTAAPALNLQPATAAAIAETSARLEGEDPGAAADAGAEDPEKIAGATLEEAAGGDG